MTQKIKILSVNQAGERGRKFPVDRLVLNENGIEGDAHAGTVRQVSMFDVAEAERFYRITGAKALEYGQFAENILFEAKQKFEVKIFDLFQKGDVLLEVTQKGKPFHDEFREPGNYVMPREGIFCRVKNGGVLKAGDEMEYVPKVFRARIITLSDRASKGIYEDRSGPAITRILEEQFQKIGWRLQTENKVIADDEQQLKVLLQESLNEGYDLVVTTGGTGIGPRDITPEVMRPFITKEIPGIIEMIRWKFGLEKPAALVSRALAGVNGTTLMFALPGSVKAVKEYTGEIGKHLQHLFYMVHGVDLH
jgi:molybdenum cofactor synthesis domain-containing protein